MTDVREFFVRIYDEVVRSLGETFGLLSQGGEGLTESLADGVTRAFVAAIIVLIFFVAYVVLRRGVVALLERNRYAREFRGPVVSALRYVVTLLAALAVLSQFGVGREFVSNTAVAAVFAFLFYLGYVVGNRLLSDALQRYDFDRSLGQLLRNILAVLVVTIGLVTVLGQFGVNVISVVTTLGVVGIAVGFAAQETLSNFIAGITLLIERPFGIGDWVDLDGQVGRVDQITLRTTRIVTRENILTSIPNAIVASSQIINLSGGGPLRVSIPVGIAYKESARQAREVMLPVIERHEAVLRSPGREPRVLLAELGDSSVNLVLQYWIAPADIARQPVISAEILEGCKETLDDAGIEIPFPHLQLFIDEAKGLPPVLEPLLRRGSEPRS